MTELFRTPALGPDEESALAEIHGLRDQLRHVLGTPRRWQGMLRRTLLARAIQGSNSIEGYNVSVEDAVAAVDEEEPLTADQRPWAEIVGYRRAMSYVLQAAHDPDFGYEPGVLRSMHFMLLSHELSKGPGRYRQSSVYVVNDATGRMAYEGPEHERVPSLVAALMSELESDRRSDSLVKGAMAHLNLVMIHPFRDGNGRMARALQTLVLARDAIVEAPFASIEEWLGHNTPDYYAVLGVTGAGSWRPERDVSLWVRFNLRAHHMQAQTVRRRMDQSARLWQRLEDEVATRRLPARAAHALFDAAGGLRVRRPGYQGLAEVELRTAVRDLNQLVDAGLLLAEGATRGRHYRATPELMTIAAEVRAGAPAMVDPFPDLMSHIALEHARLRPSLDDTQYDRHELLRTITPTVPGQPAQDDADE
jgi:Fic family protein